MEIGCYKCGLLRIRVSNIHNLPSVLRFQAKKAQRKLNLQVPRTRIGIEVSPEIRNPPLCNDQVLGPVKFQGLHVAEFSVLYQISPMRPCNGNSCIGCSNSSLSDNDITLVEQLSYCGFNRPKPLRDCLPHRGGHLSGHDLMDLIITGTWSLWIARAFTSGIHHHIETCKEKGQILGYIIYIHDTHPY